MDAKEQVYICRCEEISRREIEEAIANGATTLNEIKRWTRAGMGLCQGKICAKNVSRIISEQTEQPPERVLPATTRQPVRPVSIRVISETNQIISEIK
ncbi:MAG: (2Fe-2S)-binding protein [Clostridia bacterium]|nr:(2Fe-2S)-binding protein [Clostridia bacterium]